MSVSSFEAYKTFVFDCDGVILDSNKVKTEAFHSVALPYGEAAAAELVKYHTQNGGISRYEKFRYFLSDISGSQVSEKALENLLSMFAETVTEGLMACRVAPGLQALKKSSPEIPWMVVSGGDQKELRQVFKKRGLDQMFSHGIFGSPDTKPDIFKREIGAGRIELPAVYFGDSRHDYLSSVQAGLDFVFVSDWSEFTTWPSFFEDKAVRIIPRLDPDFLSGRA